MPTLSQNLVISRCPHCSVANPNLSREHQLTTQDHTQGNPRKWAVYTCGRCGGLVTAWARNENGRVEEYFPATRSIKEDIPERPRAYLQQALESLHAPAGAVMLAASAVDRMLNLKGYTDGGLHARIVKAAGDHVITQEMATWSHEVRLDAIDQRHAEEATSLPTPENARRVIDFAMALAELLFVLPGRVQRGISQAHEDG